MKLIETLRQNLSEDMDSHAVHELASFIENDHELFTKMITPIIRNYQRKMKKGIYDKEKAIKGFLFVVEAGAKKYMKEFGSNHAKWHQTFPVPVRRAVAAELEEYYLEDVKDNIASTQSTYQDTDIEIPKEERD
jgi:hypothetical protein